ncbi:MAG: phosphate ABC transporter permease PstA [Paracoccus sp. (in: a-proteobacteria)]|nr:phosphate ABC transporter permease PstA [Paracoccus sp. (in: a-proteobacteria)]
MTDATNPHAPAAPAASEPRGARKSLLVLDERTKRRNRAESRFKAYGIGAIAIAALALLLLVFTVLRDGLPAFTQTFVSVPVYIDPAVVDPEGNRDPEEMRRVITTQYAPLLVGAVNNWIEQSGTQIEGLTNRDVASIFSSRANQDLRFRVLNDPELVGQTIDVNMLAASRIDGMFKGRVTEAIAAIDSRTSVAQYQLAHAMQEAGTLETRFNWHFITRADAPDNMPEAAGLGVALLGSLYMMLTVLLLAVPIGVAASIYLEEFAPKNRLTDVIEVNIANLAAVPSIVFGILGLAAFIQFMHLPRSASIVGGLVLTLMTLPTIIISTRAALKSVPPSIRDAALGVGASRMQTVFHHVLPLAMPGILTGTIIGLAQALGETAPLLLIGMVAFVQTYPAAPWDGGLTDPASALPVQVYNWTQRSDPAFFERASGAIIVLLIFLLCMNVLAVYLRRKFERRW